MNQTSLVDYGIQNEESDIRVHVCPQIRRVYVYPTNCGVEAIETNVYRRVFGYQPGWDKPTSEGYLVPPDCIKNCVELMFRELAWNALNFKEDDTTSTKGDKAVTLVKSMLKRGLLPLPTESEVIDERDMQISGTDIFVKANCLKERDIRIQVKCDFKGGRKNLGGSGNLFLQVRESNPFGHY